MRFGIAMERGVERGPVPVGEERHSCRRDLRVCRFTREVHQAWITPRFPISPARARGASPRPDKLLDFGSGCSYRSYQQSEISFSLYGNTLEVTCQPRKHYFRKCAPRTFVARPPRHPKSYASFHQRIIDSGAGTEGLPLLTWFFAAPDARYVCAYSYQILRLDRMGDFTLDQLKLMVRNFIPQPAEFIGYCGLHTVWRYTNNILELLDEIEDRQVLIDLVGELQLYAARSECLDPSVLPMGNWIYLSSYYRR